MREFLASPFWLISNITDWVANQIQGTHMTKIVAHPLLHEIIEDEIVPALERAADKIEREFGSPD